MAERRRSTFNEVPIGDVAFQGPADSSTWEVPRGVPSRNCLLQARRARTPQTVPRGLTRGSRHAGYQNSQRVAFRYGTRALIAFEVRIIALHSELPVVSHSAADRFLQWCEPDAAEVGFQP